MTNEKQQDAQASGVERVVSWIRPTELLLSYPEFNNAIKGRKFNANTERWLSEWKSWDLACSPMDDKERSLIRYGHYLGFFSNLSD